MKLDVSGAPERVIVCHCDYCQRRTGTVSQVSAWFFEGQLGRHPDDFGVFKGPDNPGVEYRFCRSCGTTLYWRFTFLDELTPSPVYGIAVGCFVDPGFPAPDIEIHTGNRHDWFPSVPGADQFHALPPLERLVPAPGDPTAWRSEPRKSAQGGGYGELIESPMDDDVGFQFSTEIIEVSDGGLRLTCPREISAGVLDLWVTVSGIDQKFHLNGQVKWSAEQETGRHELGVEIINNPLTSIGLWQQTIHRQ